MAIEHVGSVAPTGRRLRVLVVDANPDAREQLQVALGDDCTLQFATGVGEALEAIVADAPDLLVSEVNLLDGNGFRLCEQIRTLPDAEQLPIMLVTERASIHDKVAGFQAGADDYVVKPVDARLFHARIRLLFRIKGLHRARRDMSA